MGIREELAKKWKTPYFSQKLKSIKFNDVGLRGIKNQKNKIPKLRYLNALLPHSETFLILY